ncbi:MAG TPA: hypothetical protein VGN72_20235 [Tepidisphaeraceae bacterium]|jgi:hypothetical protein|nr:hypothetical protein [Tepidisphaeraceae bacterium]
MREDMAKVLVERPRIGRGLKYPRGAGRERLENRPTREPIKRPHRNREKHLNENLAPLRRFLLGHVGQPWDKVYSEICERINRNSAVQLHIWQHLMWEVTRDPIQLEQQWERQRRYGHYGRDWLYVDPETRLLALSRPSGRRSHVARALPAPFVTELGVRAFKRINGVWYEIQLRPVEPNTFDAWDVLLSHRTGYRSRKVNVNELKHRYGRAVCATAKRPLTRQEIRTLLSEMNQVRR